MINLRVSVGCCSFPQEALSMGHQEVDGVVGGTRFVVTTKGSKASAERERQIRREVAELLAQALVQDYLHPRPYCRVCMTQDCPTLTNAGKCPAERPIKWLSRD